LKKQSGKNVSVMPDGSYRVVGKTKALNESINKEMTTTNNKLEQKIKADFIAYFGNEPKEIKIENGYAYVDGFYCRILNNKSIKKTHGIAWRRDN